MTVGAILWADSFGSQTVVAYTVGGTAPTFSTSAGRAGRSCAVIGANDDLQIAPDAVAHKLWIASAAISPDGTNRPSINMRLTVGGVPELTLNLGNGQLTINNGATLVGTAPVIPVSAYTYVAVRGYFDSSAGTVDVWYNETNVLSATGLNMPNPPTTMQWIAGNSNSFHLCDLVIQGSATGSDTPVGDRAVFWSAPTGAGATSSWSVTGAATGWQATNESPPDGDTSYISSNTPGQITTMAMADLPADAATVQAVVPKLYLRKTDAGSRTVAPEFRIGGSNYEGTPQNMGTGYSQIYQVYSVSPATSVAWTVAEVNGAEAGVKLDA